MKPAELTYHRPGGVSAAVALLAGLGDGARVLGGGQSLVPDLNARRITPEHLVDITGINTLRGARRVAGGVRYGATTTHQMVEDGLVPDAGGGLLTRAAAGIGHRAVRTRGTLGGSLAHADPAAEWPTVFAALDATVEVCGARGVRSLPARELPRGAFRSALAADEIVVAVEVHGLMPGRWWGLYKTAGAGGSFAASLAVVLFDTDARGGLCEVALWLGAARETPVRLPATELLLTGRPAAGLDVAAVLPGVAQDLGTVDGALDHTARHTLRIHAATVCRALHRAERVGRSAGTEEGRAP
ncbi:FAD binding domain-containing protein [Streptomyces coffeae]|uniref:FAD binding domain-containing protein n=1 Tax=Streptomyces coffeae TaxID=621382 RepID=A0ABS1NB82_9ACTN|nr:FAD binding domain-containing protein [Streptomyces coffeae]MBL1097341.1 FAD binding domain-containing protein [Streptomyces coffeae]